MKQDMNKGGGPAFPMQFVTQYIGGVPSETDVFPGMTLRDYFAAQCISKMLETSDYWDTEKPETLAEAAKAAYAMADAMLAERQKS